MNLFQLFRKVRQCYRMDNRAYAEFRLAMTGERGAFHMKRAIWLYNVRQGNGTFDSQGPNPLNVVYGIL